MDPYLERIVLPAINAFRNHTRLAQAQKQPTDIFTVHSRRFTRLTELIYRFIQVRGRKTIGMILSQYLKNNVRLTFYDLLVRLFPHQVV